MPFGALVEYLPTPRPDTKKGAFKAKTSQGTLVGYFVQPGGKWSGDYLVADFTQLQQDPDLPPSKCSVHRTTEIFFKGEEVKFPLFDYREKVATTVQVPKPEQEPSPSSASATPGQIDGPVEREVPLVDSVRTEGSASTNPRGSGAANEGAAAENRPEQSTGEDLRGRGR